MIYEEDWRRTERVRAVFDLAEETHDILYFNEMRPYVY